MPTAAELADWDLRHFWHAFTAMDEYEPLVIERAQGVWLFDTEGNRYLDGVSSLWCNLHGHRHPRIDAAIVEQLGRVAHSTSLGLANIPAVELARRLAELAPGDLEHVFYSSDGASAVETALKMAFQYWLQCPSPCPAKTKYIAYDHAYHGDTIGGTSLGGIERFQALFAPLLFDVIRLPAPDASRLPAEIDPQRGADHYLAELEEVLEKRHTEVAALVIEPLVQGAAGMILQPAGYLRGVRELTKKYNVLLIADEVVTGFGRTGRMFACDHEQVVPDLMCLGKGLSGGYLPLAATVATGEVFNAFLGDGSQSKTFQHGHTYGGNPLAAAAALASLDVLEQERVLEQMEPKIVQLAEILAGLQDHPHVAETRQIGLIGAVQLAADGQTGNPYPAELRAGAAVCREAIRRGVWLRPLGDVIVIVPPLSISSDELALLGDVLAASLDAATLDEPLGTAVVQSDA